MSQSPRPSQHKQTQTQPEFKFRTKPVQERSIWESYAGESLSWMSAHYNSNWTDSPPRENTTVHLPRNHCVRSSWDLCVRQARRGLSSTSSTHTETTIADDLTHIMTSSRLSLQDIIQYLEP
ncbi:hypothetical protein C2E23DRAFT_395043 [Lenzites betulinus]|nr:hypothetical protein C2E23DRAFT_395043 [Lenzites betulinus]